MKNRRLLLVMGFICLALILAALPFIGACAKPAPTPVKPIELSVSHLFPAAYGQAIAIADWTAEIERRTEGKVTFTLYPVGTLVSPVEMYEGVVKGATDIGMSCPSYTRGRFPLQEVLELPGLYPFNAVVTSRVGDDFCRKFKPEEFADTHLLYLHVHIPGTIMTVDKPVSALEDIKGMRIRATGMAAELVEALGAVPVPMPASDAYDALQKGVIDGTVGSPNMLKGWRFGEVTKYTTIAPEAGYVTGFFVAMNLDKWNALPRDMQKIFDEVSIEWVEYTGEAWNEMEIEGYKYAKEELGHTFITLPPEEAARWHERVIPLHNNYVKGVEAKGLPGKEALDFCKEQADKYSKIYPPLKLE